MGIPDECPICESKQIFQQKSLIGMEEFVAEAWMCENGHSKDHLKKQRRDRLRERDKAYKELYVEFLEAIQMISLMSQVVVVAERIEKKGSLGKPLKYELSAALDRFKRVKP